MNTNRPGAGGHVGGEYVANAPADGYTLMLGTIAHNGASDLFRNLRYDPTNDLQPVALLAESPSVLMVNNDVPAKTVNELLALARARPGQLNYGSAGNGSAMHMAAELFKYMTRISRSAGRPSACCRWAARPRTPSSATGPRPSAGAR